MKLRKDRVLSYVNRTEKRRSDIEAAGSRSRSFLDLTILSVVLGAAMTAIIQFRFF